MQSPRESLLTFRARDKLVGASEAVRLIRDGDSVAAGGFLGTVEGAVEAYTLPQGVISHLLRDTAGGKPGLLTHVGLGTFVDPRHGGGKVNARTIDDWVEVMTIDGEEYLFYRALPLDVALLRGTTADVDGNVTMEREALTGDSLSMATAVHNAGGLVVVQVERIAELGSLRARDVEIPGVLVDCVVVARPEHHCQTFGTVYSPALSGEHRVPLRSIAPLALGERKVIARRAAMELRPGSVVSLGIGLPEGVAAVANEERVLDYLTLTADTGVIGGLPAMGRDFGAAVNAQAVLDQPAQFDLYDGGGLDNIAQNARHVVFVGTFAAGSRPGVHDGALVIEDHDAKPKFVAEVEQRTFSGPHAAAREKQVLYVTERCVLRLTAEGLELTEIAPGVDLERDVLSLMGFEPIVRGRPRLMDERLFALDPMGLRDDLLTVPLEARFTYDAERNRFFLNLEGMWVTSAEEIEAVRAEIEARLAAVGRRVHVIVNYDNFYLAPDPMDEYTAALRDLADRYYAGVTRYTTSAFLRLRLGEMLTQRSVAPHIHLSREEAVNRLGRSV